VLTTSDGKTLRFADADLRALEGRLGQGVQAINLAAGARIVGADWVAEDDNRMLWVTTTTGWAKRSALSGYPRKGRATGGVATVQLPAGTSLAGAAVVSQGEDFLLISGNGRAKRLYLVDVPEVPRDRKGSAVFKPEPGDEVVRAIVLPG
jgi:DNA gyrase subunit A